jgi:hypothetical protein
MRFPFSCTLLQSAGDPASYPTKHMPLAALAFSRPVDKVRAIAYLSWGSGVRAF